MDEGDNLGVGWYVEVVDFPDAPNNSDKVIIDTITCYSAALPYATSPEEVIGILDILLTSVQELSRRVSERANA